MKKPKIDYSQMTRKNEQDKNYVFHGRNFAVDGSRKPCFDLRDFGHCRFGDGCYFSHDMDKN
eukprot:UN24141